MSADVQLEDVWIRFGDFVAARDVNIHINGGEFFSFLGPSGCGKTTLLRSVSGFLEPSQVWPTSTPSFMKPFFWLSASFQNSLTCDLLAMQKSVTFCQMPRMTFSSE